jgi:NADH-quinone oxidoreductase subunit M
MFENLLFPWVSLSLIAPLIAAFLAWRDTSADRARLRAGVALAISATSLVAARLEVGAGTPGALHLEPWGGLFLQGWFGVDALNAIPLPLFAFLALGVTLLAPRRDVNPRWICGVLLVTTGTLAGYAAENLVLMVAAWAASAAPFLTPRFFAAPEERTPRLSHLVLIGSLVFLAAGCVLLVMTRPAGVAVPAALGLSTARTGGGPWLHWVFYLLMAAVVLRKGLLPFHSWIVTGFERGPLLPQTLLVNGHLGAFLTARLALPLLPDVAREDLPWIGKLALITAAYTALLVLVERKPRRLLALISISQASFILVGLTSNHATGIAGALLHWQVVAIATTVVTAVYAGLEARIGSDLDTRRYLGLAAGAPRLAVFFLVGGLALVGLPLTLGFCAEDLLLYGTLTRHPQLGVIMPLVTALNAFSVVRLWARLFLGQPGLEVRGLADALPRERWVLTAAVVFLLLAGLLPRSVLRLPTLAAERLGETAPHHQADARHSR